MTKIVQQRPFVRPSERGARSYWGRFYLLFVVCYHHQETFPWQKKDQPFGRILSSVALSLHFFIHVTMAPTELSRCIASEDWNRAVELATRQPRQAQQWSKRTGFFEGRTVANVLSIHEAAVGGAPLNVMQALVQAYPDGLQQVESSYQRLPLHCACRKHANPAVIQLLCEAAPQACLAADALGRLPLHYALSNGADPAVVQLLMTHGPEAARGLDQRGWTPLHVACSMGASVPVVESILKAYPEATLIKTRKGSTIAKTIPKLCPHRAQLIRLLSAEQKKVEKTVALPRMKIKKIAYDEMVYV